MIKRSIAKAGAVLVFIALFSLPSVTVFASEEFIREKALRSRGYPQQVLSALNEKAKDDLYQADCVFESAVLQYYDETTGVHETQQVKAGEQPISPRGQIQGKHLALTWAVSRRGDNARIVVFCYDWKTLPFNRWQDPIGISWDGNKLYMQTGSFFKIDFYEFRLSPTDETLVGTNSEETSYANGNLNGVTWYAKLKGYTPGITVLHLGGYTSFVLIPETSHGSSRLYANYVHKKLSTSVSLSIPNFGSFSVSGGDSYDELGSQIDIKW